MSCITIQRMLNGSLTINFMWATIQESMLIRYVISWWSASIQCQTRLQQLLSCNGCRTGWIIQGCDGRTTGTLCHELQICNAPRRQAGVEKEIRQRNIWVQGTECIQLHPRPGVRAVNTGKTTWMGPSRSTKHTCVRGGQQLEGESFTAFDLCAPSSEKTRISKIVCSYHSGIRLPTMENWYAVSIPQRRPGDMIYSWRGIHSTTRLVARTNPQRSESCLQKHIWNQTGSLKMAQSNLGMDGEILIPCDHQWEDHLNETQRFWLDHA
jgi:hypothetical protein